MSALKLKWSETREPNEDVRYHHAVAETALGRIVVSWKGWKTYPSYDIQEAPLLDKWDYCGSFTRLDQAQHRAEDLYALLVSQAAQELGLLPTDD